MSMNANAMSARIQRRSLRVISAIGRPMRNMPFPGQPSLGYFQVPPEVIEEAEDLARWAKRSVEVAQRAGVKKRRVRLKPDPQKKGKVAKKRKPPARKK